MESFRAWLDTRFDENDFRSGAKIGLYPDIADALGQYPPLYGIPKAADLITYMSLVYGDKGPPTKDGYYLPNNVQLPSLDGVTPRYLRRGPHRHQLH
jgi:hypothetical protein